MFIVERKPQVGDFVTVDKGLIMSGYILEINGNEAVVEIDNHTGNRIDSFKADDSSVVLLDYKECPLDDFQSAMSLKDSDIAKIANPYLYILYTKFQADARTCSRARTSYAYGVGLDSSHKADAYKEELQKRGFMI